MVDRLTGPRLRGGSRTAATSKMKRFLIIVNGFQLRLVLVYRPLSCKFNNNLRTSK